MQWRDLGLIRRSGLMDEAWYLSNNPDVARIRADPALHYLLHGGFEGRDPSPDFHSAWYLKTHADARTKGVNPLVHFLRTRPAGEAKVPTRSDGGSRGPFMKAYLREIRSSASNWWEDNDDPTRIGPRTGEDMPREGDVEGSVRAAIQLVDPYQDRWEWLFGKLADKTSREVLVKVLAFRALDHRRVRLPLNTPSYWKDLERMKRLAEGADEIPLAFHDWRLQRMDLHSIGIPLSIYGTPKGCYQALVLEQYRCGKVAVKPGDYVVDGGACWGETALYFARRAGPRGRVFSFEFLPENLAILQRNLALNPEFSGSVQIIERALWKESESRLTFEANGPATCVDEEGPGESATVPTLSIDDLVSQQELPRLDFIKLDIEGAELRALQGAASSLARFRPKLAISVYHQLQDFFEIPEFLDALGLGYRFFLRHFTIHGAETVLFAEAPRPRRTQ